MLPVHLSGSVTVRVPGRVVNMDIRGVEDTEQINIEINLLLFITLGGRGEFSVDFILRIIDLGIFSASFDFSTEI